MEKTLRLLIIEDVEDHALLILRELQKGGLDPAYQRIETVAGLEEALNEAPDAVISDFSLPGFNALDALRMVKARGLDIPFIIVSGVMGEETAVEAMKAGAHDFILKGRYSRLVPALERELQEAAVRRERKHAGEELLLALEKLQRQQAEMERQHEELLHTYHKLEAETAQRIQAVEELRSKDQLLIQQSRMAAMGEMLVNISHHWRQPLNVLGLKIQELGLSCKQGAFSEELLDENIGDAMSIIQHMSQFINDFQKYLYQSKEKISFSVGEVIAKTVALVEETFRIHGIGLEVTATDEARIYGYPTEYGQVLLNLLNNARDALLAHEVSDARITVGAWVEDGRTVVTVTDNAGGIREDIIDKIFDAYFTTKELGKGSGVGLFIAKVIIEKDMGGRLSARNVAGGAEFRIEV